MIRLIEIEADEWRVISVPKIEKRLLVEIASDRRLDFGVLTDRNLTAFEADEDYDPVVWFENMTWHDFEVPISDPSTKLSLVIWNANEASEARVAYRLSEKIG
jgi:hypothetical protein